MHRLLNGGYDQETLSNSASSLELKKNQLSYGTLHQYETMRVAGGYMINRVVEVTRVGQLDRRGCLTMKRDRQGIRTVKGKSWERTIRVVNESDWSRRVRKKDYLMLNRDMHKREIHQQGETSHMLSNGVDPRRPPGAR